MIGRGQQSITGQFRSIICRRFFIRITSITSIQIAGCIPRIPTGSKPTCTSVNLVCCLR